MIVRRRVRALFLAVFLAVLAAVLLSPQPASALGFDCTDAPAPEMPGRGLTGFFSGEPNPLPPPGDPFAADATTTIYEQYGYAGLRWNNYDLGCGPDAARSPDAVAGTAIANWLFNLPKVAVAFTNAVVSVAFSPSFFSVFDPVVEGVSDALYTNVFAAWVPITLAATGFLLIWRARRANLASSTAAVAWAALVLVVATALFRWPVEAGSSADASMSAALGSVSRAVGAEAAGGPDAEGGLTGTASATHEALLYNAWAAGTFGDAKSETARTYGPAIFDATALTWREAHTLRTDPAAGKKIVDAKQRKFSQTAEKIKSEDPDAYQYLTGKRSDSRVGYALLAAFGALCALPFLFGAALMILASFLIMRLSVMLFPAVATLGVFPAMRHTVTNIANMVAGALVNALLFGVAAVVSLRGIQLLLAPAAPLPQWLAMTLLLLAGVVLWVALRPVRRLALMLGADVKAAGGRFDLSRHLRPRRSGAADDLAPDDAPEAGSRPDRAAQPLRAELFSLGESGSTPGRVAGPEATPPGESAGRPAPAGLGPVPRRSPVPRAPFPPTSIPQTPVGRAGTHPADGSLRDDRVPAEAYAGSLYASSTYGSTGAERAPNSQDRNATLPNGHGSTPYPAPARWRAARPDSGVTARDHNWSPIGLAAETNRDNVPLSATGPASIPTPPDDGFDPAADLSGIYRPAPRPDGS